MRWLLTIISCLYICDVRAEEFAVVVSSGSKIQSLESKSIRDLFLKKRSYANKQKIVPINLLGNQTIRTVFEENVLRMEREDINHYWINNHFQGISPPVTQASLTSIKLFVERVDGAMGYIPLSMVDDKLKVIYEF